MPKYLVRHPTIAGAALDAAVSSTLDQVNCEDTEILVREGIYDGQKGQTKSLEDLLRQLVNMQRTFADIINVMGTTAENSSEASKTRLLNDAVLKSVQNSTKTVPKVWERSLTTNIKGISTHSIQNIDYEVLLDSRDG